MSAGLLCCVIAPTTGFAEPPVPAATAQDLQRRLAEPVSVGWSGSSLRDALLTRARLSGIAMLVDRRIDPGLTVELALAEQPTFVLLEKVAAAHQLGISFFGPVVVVGPPTAMADLRTVATLRQQETQTFPIELRNALARKSPLAWSDLAEPRAMLLQAAAEARLSVANAELLPHDLWPANALPPLTLLERLTLLTAPFDLTFQIDHTTRRLTLRPIDESPRIARSYTPASHAEETFQRWKKLLPEAELRRDGATIIVRARVEDHEKLRPGGSATKPVAASPSGTKPPLTAPERRYTLRLKNKPFAELIKLLRDTHMLPIEVDEAAIRDAGISLDKWTNVEVADATLEELLQQAGAPLGLSVRAEAGKLRIVPAAK
ncbi:MAG: hypothetical protein C0483_12495 [Pirellula sp.]|nr:hypothetical protein [Pirellula sp.]